MEDPQRENLSRDIKRALPTYFEICETLEELWSNFKAEEPNTLAKM
jgi:hypothetical protein